MDGDAPEGNARPRWSLNDFHRWEDGGATWRLVAGEEDVIELCTCYGEPVDLVRAEPELISYLHRRIETDMEAD
jgi:hypothetical protein